MTKLLPLTLAIAVAGIFGGGAALAQSSTQAPADANKPAAAAPKSAASAQVGGAAKGGQGAGVKKPATTAGAAAAVLKTAKDKRSYAIGLNIGAKVASELKAGGVDMDSAVLARGIRDSLTGTKHLMTDEEVKTTLTALETELREKARAREARWPEQSVYPGKICA